MQRYECGSGKGVCTLEPIGCASDFSKSAPFQECRSVAELVGASLTTLDKHYVPDFECAVSRELPSIIPLDLLRDDCSANST